MAIGMAPLRETKRYYSGKKGFTQWRKVREGLIHFFWGPQRGKIIDYFSFGTLRSLIEIKFDSWLKKGI